MFFPQGKAGAVQLKCFVKKGIFISHIFFKIQTLVLGEINCFILKGDIFMVKSQFLENMAGNSWRHFRNFVGKSTFKKLLFSRNDKRVHMKAQFQRK